jgi:hypothetical protein
MSSNLNLEVVKGHKNSNRGEQQRCRSQYMNNETFRNQLRDGVPHLRAVERIYQVAIKVNRFQKEELQHCVS